MTIRPPVDIIDIMTNISQNTGDLQHFQRGRAVGRAGEPRPRYRFGLLRRTQRERADVDDGKDQAEDEQRVLIAEEAFIMPVIHLDRIVFGPGWLRREPADVSARLAGLLGDAMDRRRDSIPSPPRADLAASRSLGCSGSIDPPGGGQARMAQDPRPSRQAARRPARRLRGRLRLALRPHDARLRGAGRPGVERWLGGASATPVVRLRGDGEVARLLARAAQPQLSTAPTRVRATRAGAGRAGGDAISAAAP